MHCSVSTVHHQEQHGDKLRGKEEADAELSVYPCKTSSRQCRPSTVKCRRSTRVRLDLIVYTGKVCRESFQLLESHATATSILAQLLECRPFFLEHAVKWSHTCDFGCRENLQNIKLSEWRIILYVCVVWSRMLSVRFMSLFLPSTVYKTHFMRIIVEDCRWNTSVRPSVRVCYAGYLYSDHQSERLTWRQLDNFMLCSLRADAN